MRPGLGGLRLAPTCSIAQALSPRPLNKAHRTNPRKKKGATSPESAEWSPAAVGALGMCFRVFAKEFVVVLPEAPGFLSSVLLEDPYGGLERAARALLKDVEEMSGEKLKAFM